MQDCDELSVKFMSQWKSRAVKEMRDAIAPSQQVHLQQGYTTEFKKPFPTQGFQTIALEDRPI